VFVFAFLIRLSWVYFRAEILFNTFNGSFDSPVVVAVDKTLSASLADAREAMINAVVDMLASYRATLSNPSQFTGQLPCPYQLRLVPLYVLAMLKSVNMQSRCSIGVHIRLSGLEPSTGRFFPARPVQARHDVGPARYQAFLQRPGQARHHVGPARPVWRRMIQIY
jgi:Sec23/Sec24 helical domain